ncbi:site-specific recombinase XerD [Nonomuraea thailandensis]|uniref:Site-specific recombinase XerD n=1 Tax=Nonomuraea thailandensis TaxID=1188745 RepID=A0A9X2G7J1_9ACTN|nr:tyrosine-type recombinase/integrase [Nonomuraea thailandensis]MCP2353706.1 site-specific recombinase XerD [Nonomuraea thailandensis]
MNDPLRVQFSGPLARHAPDFRAELVARGYTPGSAAPLLQVAAQLSRWMQARDLNVADLTAERVREFFAQRRAKGLKCHISPRALGWLTERLAAEDLLPVPDPTPMSSRDELLARYRRYLMQERGLAEGTTTRYLTVARRFLAASPPDEHVGGVSAAAALAFVTAECAGKSTGWAGCVTVAVRSFLRFLHLDGLIAGPLAQAVLMPAQWRLSALPNATEPEAVAALLASCDPGTIAGRRGYAVLVVLARLGLRAGEVAALQLSDVGWRDGTLRVRGKGSRVDVLPLPADVGQAIGDYVRGGRPRQADGALFRRIGAPHGELEGCAVTNIVYRACDRAGLPRAGAHRLRHATATAMLNGGASLPQIAQVLRHTDLSTTAIYAKADRQALGMLARPWPGGAA